MDDLINRAEVLSRIDSIVDGIKRIGRDAHVLHMIQGAEIARKAVNDSPSAQPEQFEWCTDCKEYDQDKHCCPRWTKVIRNTVAELKAEQRWHTGEPTEDGDYLVFDAEEYYTVDAYYTHNGTVEYGTPLAYKGWQSCNHVKYWMPLPKPYEVEE